MAIMNGKENKENKNPVYLSIKYSLLIICVIITSYRIYMNYKTYCEYKAFINSKVELSEQETLPQISICFYEIINEDKLSNLSITLFKEYHNLINDPSKFRKWKKIKFTFDQLFNLSYDYKDYFINCTFLDQNAIKELNCSNFYTVTMSFKKKCFNFFHRPIKRNRKDDRWTYNRILLQNRPWVQIFINKNNLKHNKKIDIAINPYFSIPNTEKTNPGLRSYIIDYTQYIFMSYEIQKSIRLPEPYETRCLNYTDFGYVNRQHCIYECQVFAFLRNYSGWTEDLLVNSSFAKKIDNLKIKINYTSNLNNDCEKNENKCKHLDCISNEYKIINKYHKLDAEKISEEIDLRLYLNSVSMNSYEYQELFSIETTFVTMFIGPASLWLGLSIYSLTKLIFWFLCEIAYRKAINKVGLINYDLNYSKTRKNDEDKLDKSVKFNFYLNGYDYSNHQFLASDINLIRNISHTDLNRSLNFSKKKQIKKPTSNLLINNFDAQLNKSSACRFNN